jgi:glycosyltransferase involved in cell wall biosynthesis
VCWTGCSNRRSKTTAAGNRNSLLTDNEKRDRSSDALEVSVIIPVRNEASSIVALLRGLEAQTLLPKEIVIVDGGSEDGTAQLVGAYAKESSIPIVLFEAGAAFPGGARNIAIGLSSHEWLATIDAGNLPEENWLKELASAAKSNPTARIVYGKYLPVTRSYFTHCAAVAYVPPPHTFSPSTASSLMHRSAWEESGGFREDLRSGEDLLFFKRIRELNIPQARADKAIVHWSLQPSWAGTFRRFATYSRYGMKAGLAWEWQFRVALLYLILVGLLVAGAIFWWPLLLLPLIFLVLRTQRRVLRWHAGQSDRWWLIFNPRLVLTVLSINLVIDLAMFWGMLRWLVRDVLSNQKGLRPATSNN